jgi:hypothetical protein
MCKGGLNQFILNVEAYYKGKECDFEGYPVVVEGFYCAHSSGRNAAVRDGASKYVKEDSRGVVTNIDLRSRG